MAQDTDRKDSAFGQPARPLFLSDHLSNERTYLSYLRTAVSLMSFGIAINRFGVFLEQSRSTPGTHPLSGSARLGIGMVLIGMALLAWAAVRYVLIMHHIERQDFRPQPASILILTALVLVSGVGGVFWLFIG
jgi:putative membrane protein